MEYADFAGTACYLQHMLTREHEIVLAVDRGCLFSQFRVLMRKYAGRLITSAFFISESTLHILI
jgi:hypothetical protein